MVRSRALLAVLLASIGAIAYALDAFDEHAANILLLQVKPVQQELAITDAQRSKLNEHANWNDQQNSLLQQKYGPRAVNGRLGDADREAMSKEVASIQSILKKRILGELTPSQLVRLREISLQDVGNLALLDVQVKAKLGITDAQAKTLSDKVLSNNAQAKQATDAVLNPIIAKYQAMKPATRAEAQKLQQDYDKEREEAMKKIAPQMQQLNQEFEDLIDQTLTAEQKNLWKSLLGEPFEIKK